MGRGDAPLTETGRAQAQKTGAVLGTVGRVISSPLLRARTTAEELSTGRQVEVDERWIEVDYGEVDGMPMAEVPREFWKGWRSDVHFRPPGGETLVEAHARVAEAMEELFAVDGQGARADELTVVVSHVTPIKAAVCWALGLGVEGAWRLYLANASVTTIGWGPAGGPVLHQWNRTPWADEAGASE